MNFRAASLTLALLTLTSACGTPNVEVSQEMGSTLDSSVAKHKSPKDNGVNYGGISFFTVKTKDKSFEGNYASIIKALNPGNTVDSLKSTVPGRYKIKLNRGEYIFTGWYQHYESAGLPPYDNFSGAMFTVENNQLKISTGATLARNFSQSDFYNAANPQQMMNDGVIGAHVDIANYKVSLEHGEVIIDFPKYIDGRAF